jgi:hypothetical protein
MPSSRWTHIPTVISIVRQLQPASILDVGVGFGKWGHLFREYTDIVASEADPGRYDRGGWRTRIDGIEGFAPYLTPAHHYLYDTIYVGDMRAQLQQLGMYDVVFLGDVIEHLDLADGQVFLLDCLAHATKAVLVTTPARETHQAERCANELERHRSVWTRRDFQMLGRAAVRRVAGDMLVAVLLREGVPVPAFRSPSGPAAGRRFPFDRAVRWYAARIRQVLAAMWSTPDSAALSVREMRPHHAARVK